MAELTKLPNTQFSGLEYSNILTDIRNLIQENPTYNSNWDDFLESNAGQMLIELYSWIADQIATRVDWFVDENYISTATQKSSVIKLLKLIGYKFDLPVASEVQVTTTFSENVGTYELTPTYVDGSKDLNLYSLSADDKSGVTRNFELLNYDTTNQQYVYKLPVEVNTSSTLSHTLSFFEGTSYIDDVTATTTSGQTFTLAQNPVIRNSIRVYRVEGTSPSLTETELLQVDNFLDIKAQQTEYAGETNEIPYVINVLDNNIVQVEFASEALLPDSDRRLAQGTRLFIFYRVGGGLDGNIPKNSINETKKVTLDIGGTIDISFINPLQGVSGEDGETLEHAAYYGPLSIRTVGKTVTEEDYDIVLGSHNNIIVSKSYGAHNMPTNLYQKYGLYINPMEVWNFIVVKKTGWEDIDPSDYYKANFGSFNLENIFNGKYEFTTGSFGNQINIDDALKLSLTYQSNYDYDGLGGRTFYNYVILETPEDFGDNIYINGNLNTDLQASVTTSEYSRTTDNLLEDISPHYVDNGSDSILSSANTFSYSINTNAYYISPIDASIGFDISANWKITLDIDDKGPVSIDFSGYTPVLDLSDAVDRINSVLDSNYSNDGYNNYQDFGIAISDTTAYVSNLENKDEEDWYLGIIETSGGSITQYTINTGTDQTFDNMLTQLNLGLNQYGYTAAFVQNRTNITCYDIRIYRTSDNNYVELANTGSPYDILVAFGATPLSTEPISGGDYSNVASIYNSKYLMLMSPNTGNTSKVKIQKNSPDTYDATLEILGLDYSDVSNDQYVCYGKQSLTVIAADDSAADWGHIIYERGTINFIGDDTEIAYLNYLTGENDYVQIGHYYNTNYSSTDPEYKPIIHRIYNTQYYIDPTDPDETFELTDETNSDWQLKFTKEETAKNSLFVINSDPDLNESTVASITSKTLTEPLDFSSDKYLKLTIDGYGPYITDLSSETTIVGVTSAINATFNTDFPDGIASSDSATDTITINSNDYIDGYIIIHALSSSNAALRIFDSSNINTTGTVLLDYDTTSIKETMAEIDLSLAEDATTGIISYSEDADELGTIDLSGGYTAWGTTAEDFILTYSDSGTTLDHASHTGDQDLSAGHDWNSVNETFDLEYPTRSIAATTVTLNTDSGSGTAEDIDLTFTDDSGNSNANYQDEYIDIYKPSAGTSETFGRFWFNVGGTGTAPSAGSGTLYEVAIDTTDTAGDIITEFDTVFDTFANASEIVTTADITAGTFNLLYQTNYNATDPIKSIAGLPISITVNSDGETAMDAVLTVINNAIASANATLGAYIEAISSDGINITLQTVNRGSNESFILSNATGDAIGWTDGTYTGSGSEWTDTITLNTSCADIDEIITEINTQLADVSLIVDFSQYIEAYKDYSERYIGIRVKTSLSNLDNKVITLATGSTDALATFGWTAGTYGDQIGIKTVETGAGQEFTLSNGSDGSALTTLGWSTGTYNGADANVADTGAGTGDMSSGYAWTNEEILITTPYVTDQSVILNTTTTDVATTVTEINDSLATAGLDTYMEAYASTDYVGLRTITANDEWFQLEAGTPDALAILGISEDFYKGTNAISAKHLGTSNMESGYAWGTNSQAFDISMNGVIDTTFYTNGDYHLVLNETTDSIDMYKTNNPNSQIPDLEFYIHFMADRRHIFEDPDQTKIHTDEDDFEQYLYPYKVAGIENSFKRPVFDTFDVQGTVYVKGVFTIEEVKADIEEALREKYSLENTQFNNPIVKSELIAEVMNIDGVRYMDLTYFGLDATNSSSNVENKITPDFDELIVLSEDIYSGSTKIHGIIFSYENI